MKNHIVLIPLLGALSWAPTAATAQEPGHTGASVIVDPAAFTETAHSLRKRGATVTPAQVRGVVPGSDKDSVYTLIGPPHFGEGITRRWNYVLFLTDGASPRLRCRFQLEFKKPGDGYNVVVDRITWGSQQCADFVSSNRAS
jgi:outer membrane protein assembly factor BamE (lipoprotein component of BamABCDE complex)